MATERKHLPKALEATGNELWGDTPFHSHIRMAKIVEHSPMNGMDARQTAAEIAKRYNTQPKLYEALRRLQISNSLINWDYAREALEEAGAAA